MTILEFYQTINGNYSETIERLGTEARILKYVKKFPSSTEMENLLKSMEAEEYDDAFRFSHNLKGMCLNLGLGDLTVSASELCELLRPFNLKTEVSPDFEEEKGPMLEKVKEDYARLIDLIENDL